MITKTAATTSSQNGRNRPTRPNKTLHCESISAEMLRNRFSSEMYLNAATILLITYGSATLEINRHPTRVEANSVTIISSSHLLRIADCTEQISGTCLTVGEGFMHDMDATDMIYKRIRYGVKLYAQPIVSLTPKQTDLIDQRLRELQTVIQNTSHLYYKEVILNRLLAFYLDLSDIIDRTDGFAQTEQSTRYESMVKRFVELLIKHYRTEHKVDFYSAHLGLSSHYLTLILKQVTGRTPSDFIYWMLYSDARSLLADSKLSIQEITLLLNFSDQSAFGKFFKRRAGISPLDYRRKA